MKRKSTFLYPCLFVLSLIVIVFSSFVDAAVNNEIRITYNPAIQDYTPQVVQAILDAKSNGIRKITFEKGDYHFFNDKAFEKFCFISNHDDGLRRTSFPIIGMNDFEVDGGGSNFLFHGPMIPFLIEESSNIKLNNLSINWEHTFSSELAVVATNSKDKSIDFKISAQYPYRIENGNLIFFRKDYRHTLEIGFYWDPKTKAVAYNVVKSPPIRPYKGAFVTFNPNPETVLYEPFIYKTMENNMPLAIQAEELSPGLVRVKGIDGDLPQVGWIYVCKGHNSENRYSPAIRISDSKELNLENINVYHAGGMGLIAEKSVNVSLNKFNVVLPANSKRMVSTTADATHFVNCKGLILIENCRFENQLDDATNIHGVYTEITRKISDKSVEIKLGHFQQRGFNFASAGDSIALVDKQSLQQKRYAIVEKVEFVNNKYSIIHFKENIGESIQEGDLLDNVSWYPEAILRNNIAINNKSRGFLISTPKKVMVENNTFSNMMSAILIDAPKFNWWYESGNPQDLTIINNTFLEGTYGGAKQGLIEIHTQTPGLVKNVKIIANTFKSFSPLLVNATGVDGIVFQDNTIIQSFKYPIIFKTNVLLAFPKCSNVSIKDNRIEGFKNFKLLED
ncbi:alpha-1,3-galactosidase-related protein [Pedobacter sp. MW01-1-1]|uniref:alpha-1,3-galactosidase-related protein n=1 Tax=Pedobacter sp. MW01-1-1 TaxID=3383027 RepID=UPI003FF0B3D3